MTVEVRMPTILRPHVGGVSSVKATGTTVGEIFDGLVQQYPALKDHLISPAGDLHRFVNVYLNGRDVRYLDGLSTPVGERDEIRLLPAIAGG
jgi:molybdopterin converting factor small subunit